MTASETSTKPNWFRRLITPPRFADEEKTYIAQLLNVILIAGIILLSIRVIVAIPQGEFAFSTLYVILIVMILILIGLLILMRRGQVQLTSIILLGSIFSGMTYIAATSPTLIYDGSFAALTALAIMAGLLLGWRAAVIVIGLEIATGWWLASLFEGKPVTLSANAPLEYARDLSIIYVLIGILMYLLISSLRRALKRSQADEQNLRAQNIELTKLQGELEDRVAERTAQLNTSVEVGRIAASILDPAQLLDEIVNVIAERFSFYYVAIFTLSAQGDNAVLRAATGEAGAILKAGGHKLPLSIDSMVGYAISRRKPRIALNVGKDAVHFANPLLPATRSEVALPLIVGDDVLGALDVQSVQEMAFDEASLAVLQSVANQVATALANARSFERVQKSLEYTQRQFEVSRILFAANSLEEAYIALGQVWALLSNIDRLQMYLVSERSVSNQPVKYEMAMEWDVLAGIQVTPGVIVDLDEAPLIQLGRFDRMTIIADVNDPGVLRRSRDLLQQAGAQAALLVPLHMHGQFAGMLIAVSERPTEYQENELNLISTMVSQLALVVENLQLQMERQATVQRIETLNRQLSGEAWQRYIAVQPEIVVDSGRPPLSLQASLLELPIQVRGQAIGSLALEDANPRRQWNADEVALFQTITSEVALAIDNARLIEQTQRAAQREKDIARAADKIHRAGNLEEILRTAVYEISRITGVPDVAVQVGQEAPQGNVLPSNALPGNGQHT